MTPKVTVLLAVHNGEPHVRQAAESILAQTFSDFEFLIVDDASTDATVETIESLGDRRVRLLRNEKNLGQVPSLNRGLREARGEYVARIDHDDWCRPERFARQVAALEAEPDVGLVGAWMDAVDEHGHVIGRLRSTIADYAEFLYHTLIMRVYIAHPASMYRREPVVALGGYDEATGPAEDKDLWRRLALERWDARIVAEPLVVYRLHGNQLSQTRAAYQRDVDERSQERFLAALRPGVPVRPLRLLLAGDPALWSCVGDAAATLRDLELLLAGARERLRLNDLETERLERLVAARLLEVARMRPWRRAARRVAGHGRVRAAPSLRRRAWMAHAAALFVVPPRDLLRGTVKWLADRGARVPGLRALEGPARRSRLARIVYGKLVRGGR